MRAIASHSPAILHAQKPRDASIQPHRIRGQPRGNGVDQARQSVAQRDEHAVPGAAFRAAFRSGSSLMAHCPDQAAVLPLHFAEAGQRGQHAELFHVGGVDRADQRLDQPVEDFAAQAGGGRTRPCSRRRRPFAAE